MQKEAEFYAEFYAAVNTNNESKRIVFIITTTK